MMKVRSIFWVLKLFLLDLLSTSAFVVVDWKQINKAQTSGTIVQSSSNSGSSFRPDSDLDDDERRMEMVRTLQNQFYSANKEEPVIIEGDLVKNLPLWRVPWTELPGRSNVLHVHQHIYTDMFEQVIRSENKPWYFGHLFLPGGYTSLMSGEPRFQLKSWKTHANDVPNQNTDETEGTAIVGTLMKVVDYRRITDGRIMLLVHAMERFVVEEPLRSLPFSIANVRIIPDYDELGILPHNMSEASADIARKQAVNATLAIHDYEFKDNLFALDNKADYLKPEDIHPTSFTHLIPFAAYGSEYTASAHSEDSVPLTTTNLDKGNPSIETLLIESCILNSPMSHPELIGDTSELSLHEIERRLWNYMFDLKGTYGIALPPEVLCLLPPGVGKSTTRLPFAVDPNYPAIRRQRRLSFAASAFLERTVFGENMRQTWLEIPSTKERLTDLLERFQMLNSARSSTFE